MCLRTAKNRGRIQLSGLKGQDQRPRVRSWLPWQQGPHRHQKKKVRDEAKLHVAHGQGPWGNLGRVRWADHGRGPQWGESVDKRIIWSPEAGEASAALTSGFSGRVWSHPDRYNVVTLPFHVMASVSGIKKGEESSPCTHRPGPTEPTQSRPWAWRGGVSTGKALETQLHREDSSEHPRRPSMLPSDGVPQGRCPSIVGPGWELRGQRLVYRGTRAGT